MEVTFGGFGDPVLWAAVHQLMDLPDELERQLNAPTRAYVRDRRAMANTPMDVKELPSGAIVLADMPGVSPADVKVQVEEEGNVLTISGERRRPAEHEGGKQQAADDGGEKQQGVRYLRSEDGEADGQVHEAVPAAGQRRTRQHPRRLQGRRAHRHRRQEAAARAQETARRPRHGRRATEQVNVHA